MVMSHDKIKIFKKYSNLFMFFYANDCSRQKPPQRHPLAHLCSQARIAAVRATLQTLLHAPHLVHRRSDGGRLPNCKCRMESTILSFDRPPSTIGTSGQNFRQIGSTLYSSCETRIVHLEMISNDSRIHFNLHLSED